MTTKYTLWTPSGNWVLYDDFGSEDAPDEMWHSWVAGPSGGCVAIGVGDSKKDALEMAERIAREHNAHDALVEALKASEVYISERCPDRHNGSDATNVLAKIRLALARGESEGT